MRRRSSGPLKRLRRIALAASLAAAALVATASPAPASETIGQLGGPLLTCSNSSFDQLQPTVTSGQPYVVPALPPASALTISSWSTNAAEGAGQRYAMKVFRHIAGSTYEVVGHDSRALTPGTLNTFSTSLPVRPGDVLGLNNNDGSAAESACSFAAPGESHLERSGSLADGESGDFLSVPGFRLNITAVVEPTNAFALGKAKRNKKRGTAKLSAKLPNPGKLVLSGKGLKRQSKAADGPGRSSVKVKPRGKAKRKLDEAGKVKVKARVAFTPTGGERRTQSRRLTLKKR